MWLAVARADDPAEQGPALSPFTQSSGKYGSNLRWLPQRTQPGDLAGATFVPQRVARATSAIKTSPTRAAERATTNPMDDPFGDRQQRSVSAAAGPLRNDLSEPPIGPATPGGPARGLPSQEPPKGRYVPNALDQRLAKPRAQSPTSSQSDAGGYGCPEKPEEYFQPIGKLDADISYKQEGKPPEECKLGEKTFELRVWGATTFCWTASGLCHKPLYFEDVQLERYGHTVGPLLQPIASGAHFFLTIPILPYKMGLTPPHECMYTLGYYRPGSCAPYMLDPLPLSIRAGLAEAGVWTGLAALIP
jgi:hypothetical protein